MKHGIAAAALSFLIAFTGTASRADHSGATSYDVSDATLVKSLPGFENDSAVVNGVRLHFVAGGSGTPVVLLPGRPETQAFRGPKTDFPTKLS
jgi:hypothetical protein